MWRWIHVRLNVPRSSWHVHWTVAGCRFSQERPSTFDYQRFLKVERFFFSCSVGEIVHDQYSAHNWLILIIIIIIQIGLFLRTYRNWRSKPASITTISVESKCRFFFLCDVLTCETNKYTHSIENRLIIKSPWFFFRQDSTSKFHSTQNEWWWWWL